MNMKNLLLTFAVLGLTPLAALRWLALLALHLRGTFHPGLLAVAGFAILLALLPLVAGLLVAGLIQGEAGQRYRDGGAARQFLCIFNP